MPRCLNLVLAIVVVCLFASCAQRPVARPRAAATTIRSGRISNVRTTAYTRTESGGRHNALGTRLSSRHLMSAASDWSQFPLGTRFRIVDTKEEYVIDDYG